MKNTLKGRKPEGLFRAMGNGGAPAAVTALPTMIMALTALV